MIRPGPRNSLTDVPGLAVGNAGDPELVTGVTAVIPEAPAVAAVDVRGGGPGTRETDALGPQGTVDVVHGLVLSGGSAFGLDAAGGAMDWLRSVGRGFEVAGQRVPIVPSAILFDLATGAPKHWDRPVWWELGRQAAAAAGQDFALGNAGAGTGARAGRLKGGLGTASFRLGPFTVAALVAANPMGEVVIPGSRVFWAWPLEQGAEFGGLRPDGLPATLDWDRTRPPGQSTTIAVVATDAVLTRPQAMRMATMAQTGLARAIRPVHTPLDGDTVFALSTGRVAMEDPVADLSRLGMLAADCLSRAVARAVFEAGPLAGIPAWRELEG